VKNLCCKNAVFIRVVVVLKNIVILVLKCLSQMRSFYGLMVKSNRNEMFNQKQTENVALLTSSQYSSSDINGLLVDCIVGAI